jgi:hypothetical protein
LKNNARPGLPAKQKTATTMTLAKTPASRLATGATSQKEPAARVSTIPSPAFPLPGSLIAVAETRLAAQAAPASAQVAAQNVVQRMWDEHSPMQASPSAQKQGQNSQGQSAASDINQLAEKILPLVKRMFENESDRTGRGFRK